MRYLLLISSSGITLFFVLGSLSWLRIYFRTGMKSALLTGVGWIVIAICSLGVTIRLISLESVRGWYFWEEPLFAPFLVVLIVGGLITIAADPIYYTKESGLWKEICEKTSFWQRVIGNVPILKNEKHPPPSISKRTGLIIGISTMTLGSLIITPYILFKIKTFFSFLIAAISAFIFGLLLVIFSIIYLNKSNKSPE